MSLLPPPSPQLGRPPLGLLPPVWFLLAIILMALLHVFAPGMSLMSWPWRGTGVLPLLVGVALPVAGAMRFKRHQTTVLPFRASSSLVTDGVYRCTRNPMYLGMVLILAGLAILLGTLSPWAAVVGFAQWVRWTFIRAEERGMALQFGAAYAAYRSRVRRWV